MHLQRRTSSACSCKINMKWVPIAELLSAAQQRSWRLSDRVSISQMHNWAATHPPSVINSTKYVYVQCLVCRHASAGNLCGLHDVMCFAAWRAPARHNYKLCACVGGCSLCNLKAYDANHASWINALEDLLNAAVGAKLRCPCQENLCARSYKVLHRRLVLPRARLSLLG